MKTITDIFLSQAASVLGDTNKGLSGSVIVESLVSYANDSEIHIPHLHLMRQIRELLY